MASKVDSSALSVISEERASARKHDSNDDYESVYNHKTKSGHKKKLHPLMLGPSRQNPGKIMSLHAASKNNLSEFTQRIMSAKLLRTKQVQNQLNETQIQLNELINENRILRNLIKRQEGALKRYEGNHAELPQLIRSHNEEIRALKANNKIIRAQLKESNTKLKERESELESIKDNYNKLKKLSTEKNLLEREKLQKKVEELQEVIKEQEEKIQVLSRKVLLESKSYRHHLNIEVMKHKETQKDLNSALSMISKLESQLMAKEKPLPGGKGLLKRDNKNFMPVIVNNSRDLQPKGGYSEDSFLSRDDDRRKSQIEDSPESEIELLNVTKSSDDTPSPTQDIFPEIHRSKKLSPDVETTTEINFSKSEMFQIDHDFPTRPYSTLKSRKTPLSKRNLKFATDLELNARMVTEKLNEDMESIDEIAQKVDSGVLGPENKNRISALIEEVKASSSKLDAKAEAKSNEIEQLVEDEVLMTRENEGRRSVAKRKLEEEKPMRESIEKSSHFNFHEELSEKQQQKLENMTKTWNSIKDKIQEDRKKAEEKMKELSKFNGTRSPDVSSSESEDEPVKELVPQNELKLEVGKELKFVNFTDDAYILNELEKTDKIFNKLKTKTPKPGQKAHSPSPSSTDKKSKTDGTPKTKPKQPPDIKSFRTESKREPKYLEEFQSEYQKQNLLKALKAIDVGKDPNLSSEESDDSYAEVKAEKSLQKNGLKHIQKLTPGASGKDLMAELFGSKHGSDKNDRSKLDYETAASVNE